MSIDPRNTNNLLLHFYHPLTVIVLFTASLLQSVYCYYSVPLTFPDFSDYSLIVSVIFLVIMGYCLSSSIQLDVTV